MPFAALSLVFRSYTVYILLESLDDIGTILLMEELDKAYYRKMLLKRRGEISSSRREEATENALEKVLKLSSGHRYVLSFASFRDELNTWPINKMLAKQGRLLLPRISGLELQIFKVDNIEMQLEKNNQGLLQPARSFIEEIDPSLITLVLVPGLGFDRHNHRIGYGKGHYDRFLKKLSSHAITLGIGFTEQLLLDADLPCREHDVPLAHVNLC